MPRLLTSAAVVAALVAAAVAALLQSSTTGPWLKLRVAVELLGWDGLARVARESAAQRVLGARGTHSRRAFHELLDAVSAAELGYLVPQRRVVDEETIAEGHRLFGHLLRTGLRLFYEADLDRPHFAEMVGPRCKMLGDNPDAFYYSAVVRPDATYEITGSRRGEAYLSLTVYEAPCVGCFSSRVVADVNDHQLAFEPDGQSFVIRVSAEAPKPSEGVRNWLPLTNVSRGAWPQIITRHYYELATSAQLDIIDLAQNISIRRVLPARARSVAELGLRPLWASRLSDRESADRLERVAAFVTTHTTGMLQDPAKAPQWFSFTPNKFGPAQLFRNANKGELGAVDIAYSAGPFKLPGPSPASHAVEITGVMPPCVFANVVLWNVFMQTFAFERGLNVSLNRAQMRSLRRDTGEFRILLSRDPPSRSGRFAGHDWLCSEGRLDGTVFWRFLLPEVDDVATPQARVVELAEGDVDPRAWDELV